MTTATTSDAHPRAATKRRAGPGRPEGVSGVRDDILDAAEIEFSASGYSGASLRDVARRAHVTQALITYYFGSKHGLYGEVFLRRGREIANERSQRLANLRARGGKLQVGEVIEAFLLPALKVRETPGGRNFMRLMARVHTEPPEVSYALRNEAFDESTRLFTETLSLALPKLSKRDIYWRTTLIVGAYLYAFSDTHRLEQIAPGICDPNDSREVLAAITAFAEGGVLAPGVGAAPEAPSAG